MNVGSGRASSSGCHCTPRRHDPRASSTSAVPSGERPVTDEPLPHLVDHLVVQRVHCRRARRTGTPPATRRTSVNAVRHVVTVVVEPRVPVALVLADVLAQRPAARDVEQLDAATDAQDRVHPSPLRRRGAQAPRRRDRARSRRARDRAPGRRRRGRRPRRRSTRARQAARRSPSTSASRVSSTGSPPHAAIACG